MMHSSTTFLVIVVLSVIHCTTTSYVNCNNDDKHAPCACKIISTGTTITKQNGQNVDVEFSEAICNVKENKRRMKEGSFSLSFWCHQIKERKWIFQDINGMAVDVKVQRRNGCELRCINHCAP